MTDSVKPPTLKILDEAVAKADTSIQNVKALQQRIPQSDATRCAEGYCVAALENLLAACRAWRIAGYPRSSTVTES